MKNCIHCDKESNIQFLYYFFCSDICMYKFLSINQVKRLKKLKYIKSSL